ncbi:MAG: sigma-70 family RNA polymerase sigma factor [Kofleriaceae bacterium]
MDDRVVAAHRAASEAWPFVVELDVFAREAARRIGDGDIAKYVTADLYLAIACQAGDPRAIEILERDYFSEVDHAARKTRATPEQAQDVRGHLRRLCFTEEENRACALADFSGRGDLRGYLRVIATRELIKLVQRSRREESVDEVLRSIDLDISRAPELALLRQRHGAEIATALRAALESLDERQRALLRYSLVLGWTVDKIGELYGVHRATAARWVSAARDALGQAMREEASTRLAIPLSDVDSIVREVHSQIDVSLARIL